MIKLDNEFSVKTDSNNFELIREVKKTKIKNGKEEEYLSVDNWYCRDMQQALKLYLRETIRPSESIEDLCAKLKHVEEKIEKVCLSIN